MYLKLHAKGDLTMHGVTREVVLDVDGPTAEVKDPWGSPRFGASATAKPNRKDWGLVWNQALETGGVMVGDEVTRQRLAPRVASDRCRCDLESPIVRRIDPR